MSHGKVLKNNVAIPPQLNYEWLEKLLPKLLILPQTYSHSSGNEREFIQKSIALCEKILARQIEVKRFKKLIEDAGQSETTLNQVSKLREFFGQQTFVGNTNTAEGRLAFEMRVAMAEGHYRQIPRDILKILSDWETIVESQIGEKRLKACDLLMQNVLSKRARWNSYFQSRKKAVFGFRDRLRLLSTARRVSKLKKILKQKQMLVNRQSQQLQNRYDELLQLISKISIFHSIPTAHCGKYSARVQQLIMLALEKETTQALVKQCQSVEERINFINTQLQKKNIVPTQARTYVDKSEHSKNQMRMRLLAKRGIETFDLVSKAAEYQIRSVFDEVEKEVAVRADSVAALQSRQSQLISEMQRLKNLYNDTVARGGVKHEHESRYIIRPSANS